MAYVPKEKLFKEALSRFKTRDIIDKCIKWMGGNGKNIFPWQSGMVGGIALNPTNSVSN